MNKRLFWNTQLIYLDYVKFHKTSSLNLKHDPKLEKDELAQILKIIGIIRKHLKEVVTMLPSDFAARYDLLDFHLIKVLNFKPVKDYLVQYKAELEQNIKSASLINVDTASSVLELRKAQAALKINQDQAQTTRPFTVHFFTKDFSERFVRKLQKQNEKLKDRIVALGGSVDEFN